MIEYKPFTQVVAENKTGINFEEIIKGRDPIIQTASGAMRSLLKNKKIKDLLIKQAPGLLKNSPWVDSGFGIYFATVANLKTTLGQRAMPVIDGQYGSSWGNPLEIGSGVGLIEPWKGAKELLKIGIDNSDLMINYDSPGGRYPARWALATMLNSQISPDCALSDPVYTFADTYITPSATAAIDTVFEAFSRLTSEEQTGKNRVVILGPSYYVLALSAVEKNLPVTRMSRPKDGSFGIRTFFPSIEDVEATLPEDTGMIVLTLPNNPNGETLTNEQLRKLFRLAKERRVYIFIDLVFDQLSFEDDQNNRPNPLKVAYEEEMLDQLVVVDALSKSQNLAGIRLGWLATKNREFERIINRISVARLSNPSLTVEPLLQFEAMARIVDRKILRETLSKQAGQGKKSAIGLAIELTRTDLKKLLEIEWLEGIPYQTLNDWYQERRNWLEEAMRYYEDNLALIQYILDFNGRIIIRSPDQATYNTFIGFGDTEQNIGFDKILKLFLLTGIVAMSGQCFGQPCPQNEFWTRITYGGLSRDRIPEAMFRLLGFLNLWDEMQLGDSQRFPAIDTNFKII